MPAVLPETTARLPCSCKSMLQSYPSALCRSGSGALPRSDSGPHSRAALARLAPLHDSLARLARRVRPEVGRWNPEPDLGTDLEPGTGTWHQEPGTRNPEPTAQ